MKNENEYTVAAIKCAALYKQLEFGKESLAELLEYRYTIINRALYECETLEDFDLNYQSYLAVNTQIYLKLGLNDRTI